MFRLSDSTAVLFFSLLGIVLFGTLAACTGTPNQPVFAKISHLHANHVPDGSLRVGEVMVVATREEIRQSNYLPSALSVAGVTDERIRDGTVILARVFCCGGPNEFETRQYVYVPEKYQVSVGDIVEIWSDRMLAEGEPVDALPNTVTGVREPASAPHKACRWLPDNPALWVRVLYCDWMQSEGWVQQSGLYPVWIRPIASPVPPS
jgi:hypothetical protein